MPTNPDNHDLGKDTLGGTPPASNSKNGSPGYEVTDVNVNGVVVFLGGLLGFVFVFFGFCFVMGRLINHQLLTEYGPPTKWQRAAGIIPPESKRQDLASNPEMDQQELQRMTTIFPTPRLDVDDGNQATADLHAKEDLLLDHYSTVDGQPNTIRIPIDRAMELIVERGLPVNPAAAPTTQMAGDEMPVVHAPLTDGFARTGYELDTIEAREQRMNYNKAVQENHAALTPQK
jgi:hypothetical protein